MSITPAERLLQELGVTEPFEIDLDAIAFYAKARIRYRHLDGCEARIIGAGDAAIITVNSSSGERRKRFSIAHELGHWRHHRGKRLVCKVEEYRPRDITSPECVADGYAADLLMPHYLFKPLAREQGKLSFKAVDALVETFNVSRTATAIRLVECGLHPAFVICHTSKGRKWFARSPVVPKKWFPRDELDADSFAFGVQFGNHPDDPMPRKVGADAWFDRWDADRYTVQEQTVRASRGETLTIVTITDAKMLDD
jgi:hypothetical protein